MSFARIVSDLMTDKNLRRVFNEDPERFIRSYGINDADRAVLLTMNLTTIQLLAPNYLQTDLARFKIPEGEFRPISEQFFAEDGGLDPQYPSPAPGIFRYQPHSVSAAVINAKASKSFEVVVFGQSFLDVELHLIRTRDGLEAPQSSFFVVGTFRCTIVRAVFSPVPPDAGFNAGDIFRVRVIGPGPDPGGTPGKTVPKNYDALPLLQVVP